MDVSGDSKAYVFHGPLERGTSNEYVAATDFLAGDVDLSKDPPQVQPN